VQRSYQGEPPIGAVLMPGWRPRGPDLSRRRQEGGEVNKTKSQTVAKRPKLDEKETAKLMRVIHEIVRSGEHPVTSFKDIAEILNVRGVAAPRGGRWNARSVAKVLERSAQEARSEPE
jgi:hypothetical protein